MILSGLLVALAAAGKSGQCLKRIGGIICGPACEADGVESPKDEVAQQTRIWLRCQDACTLGIRDKLGPPGHIGLSQFSSGDAGRITGKGGSEYGDRVVAQLVHRGGMRADGSTEPRRGIGMIWNRGQSRVETR